MRGLIGFVIFISLSAFGQIQIDEPIKELGDVFEDKGVVKTYFKLENPYRDDTIKIRNIVTSCGCTAALTQDTVILPRSSVELEVSYDPSGRLGLFMKTIEVETVTGVDERNKLYLKVMGNVISEKLITHTTDVELVDYSVAPIYFFPITEFDTSYLDLNYTTTFINDLTFEIDYFKFAQVGFEVTVKDKSRIEGIENLISAIQVKTIREFKLRGFPANQVFFAEPIFKEGDIPVWSIAEIMVKSDRFNADDGESSIVTAAKKTVNESMFLMDYERFSLPKPKDLLPEIAIKTIEGKLFLNDHIELKGIIKHPKNKEEEVDEDFQEKIENAIFKFLKKEVGIGKENLTISFDSLEIHPDNKYRFLLWDIEDEEYKNSIVYRIKKDKITMPFLPTLRQTTVASNELDQTSARFKHFWQNLLIANRGKTKIKILIESSVSQLVRNGVSNNLDIAIEKGEKAAAKIKRLFKNDTGREIEVQIMPIVRGPEVSWEFKRKVDYTQFEYLNLVPITDLRENYPAVKAKPYRVNFDYYFLGIDTSSWVFNSFVKYINAEVQRYGYVELRMESSISQIKIEKRTSNKYLAYARLLESQRRLKQYLAKKLIDPNRVIFKDEQYIIQGPIYDGTIPILKYRKFQYVKIVPEKYLTQ